MRNLRDVPLRQKLFRLIAIASTLAVLLTFIGVVIFELTTYRSRTLLDLRSEAELIASMMEAPINSEESDDARGTLAILRSAQSEFRSAVVYRVDRTVFATYGTEEISSFTLPFALRSQGYDVSGNRFEIYRPIWFSDEIIGYLYMRYEMPPLASRMPQYLFLACGVLLALVAFALILNRALERHVLRPIFELANVARSYSADQRVRIRAVVSGNDEIGQMTKAVNAMIEKLEEKERERESSLAIEQGLRAEAEGEKHRFAFLADTGRILVSSLEPAATLENLVDLTLPRLADWCYIALVDEEYGLKMAASGHSRLEGCMLTERLKSFVPGRQGASLLSKVLRTGQVEFHSNLNEHEWMQGTPGFVSITGEQGAEDASIVQKLQTRSSMIVPLIARGRIIGAFWLGLSFTERRYGLQDLVMAQELASRAALSIDNAGLYHAAQQAIALRDEFLTVASHELRTPLTPLRIQVNLIRRLLKRVLPADHANFSALMRFIDTSERQVDRLAMLIDDLLDVSRISAGQLKLKPAWVNMAGVVRDVVGQYRPELESAGCELMLELEDSAVGEWDAQRVEQIVINLLSNAIKYGRDKPIEIRVSGGAAGVTLSVRDHGIGVAHTDQERIFRRFERAVSVKTYGGLGLGLYIARQIVESHGGTIWVESEPDSGATFTVFLPKRLPSRQAA